MSLSTTNPPTCPTMSPRPASRCKELEIMRVTQGCFSFLPDLTDEQISRQVQYCLEKGWAVNIEFTDDPHPRNNFWEKWGLPMFDLRDASGVLMLYKDGHHVDVDPFTTRCVPGSMYCQVAP